MLHSPGSVSKSLARRITALALALLAALFIYLEAARGFFSAAGVFFTVTYAFFAAALVAAFYIAVKKTVRRHVSDPVARLSSLTDEVVSGNLQAFADASGENEIGYLGRNLNFMIDVICRQANELEQALEDRGAALERSADDVRALREELMTSAGIADRYNRVISRDLKTKAGLVLVFARYLCESPGVKSDPQASAFARKLTDVAYDLMAAISELTDVEELSGARPPVVPVRCDFGEIVAGALGIFEPLITFKKLDISSEMGPETSSVAIDLDKVRQIVNNLVGNAVKFSEPGGRVRIRAGCEGDCVCFEIHDCGQGMTDEQQEKIFSPDSFDACTPGTAGEIGFGSGLKLARFFAELHGGSLWFETARGRGSSFYFKVPQGNVG